MTVFDDGSGPALFVAGDELRLSGGPYLALAKWDGKNWTALAPDSPRINALQSYSDGRTNSLYAAGIFPFDYEDYDGIARWNGSGWERLGDGLSYFMPDYVQGLSLLAFDDGSGPQLYVCGEFDHAGGIAANGVARWDGQSWSATGPGATPFIARSMTRFVDQSNNVLLLAVNGSSAIFAWNGQRWTTTAFNTGLFVGHAAAIANLQVGNQYSLVVFDQIWGLIQRWDGTSWQYLGGMINGACGPALAGGAFASFDDGSSIGPALFVGGRLDFAGGYLTGGVARWGIPKNPACPADIYPNGGDARVNIDDLLSVISGWGACGSPCFGECVADIDGNCVVDIDDLLPVITQWGPQPNSMWVSELCPP